MPLKQRIAFKYNQMLNRIQFLVKTTFFNTFLVIFIALGNYNVKAQQDEPQRFGETFEVQEKPSQDSRPFQELKGSESEQTLISGEITEVCQAKGCWMKVDLADGEEVFVRFKDYGFFVPTNAAGNWVTMKGKAFIEEMSVEDQQHYALDKGASQEEINKITSPKRTYRFEAEGVVIQPKL